VVYFCILNVTYSKQSFLVEILQIYCLEIKTQPTNQTMQNAHYKVSNNE